MTRLGFVTTLVIAVVPTLAIAQPEDPPIDDQLIEDQLVHQLEDATETIEIVERAPPGAATSVRRDALERTEQDDIHHVLATVPGVYVREEDGYGLRPNIGMRGAAAERSAKIAIMEDGVLIAPAPYSAPAAYYFPIVTRMSQIDVTKGPAAIKYGPNTVGGAINLIGEPMPGQRAGYLDMAIGSDLYTKLHARAAERGERWGVMAEYVNLHTNGFKRIDGGGDSGFLKNDVQLWGRWSSPVTAAAYHQLDLKVGYADESSDETYTGLSDADFAVDPQRRYAATQLDHFDWTHTRLRASWRLELGTRFRLQTDAYRFDLSRAWRKFDAFGGERDLAAVLADPTAGSNPVYYALMTGTADTTSPEEQLILGTNDRTFVSQGVQSIAQAELHTGSLSHLVDTGVRLHYDSADRQRDEDRYAMMAGHVTAAGNGALVLDNLASTLAVAAHAQDQVRWRWLEVSAGLRVEAISIDYLDRLTTERYDDVYSVWVPGGGVIVHASDQVQLLGGVHRGFSPVAPSAAAMVSPESSVNWETGARWRNDLAGVDLLGFFSDYSNLKGTCTFSSGCRASQEGDEFDGGRVHVWGLEAKAALDLRASTALAVPIDASYTLTRSAFQTSFASEFGAWGDVAVGDELPYLPSHQLALSAALVTKRADFGGQLRWQSAMRDVAGQGDDGDRTDPITAIDLNAHVRFAPWGEAYVLCNNLLDEQGVVSRRPWGARPAAPLSIIAGIKARL